jgi:hypothetical protein
MRPSCLGADTAVHEELDQRVVIDDVGAFAGGGVAHLDVVTHDEPGRFHGLVLGDEVHDVMVGLGTGSAEGDPHA